MSKQDFPLTNTKVFHEFPFLNKEGANFQDIFSNWKKYKYEVPVYGAIMLDELLEKVSVKYFLNFWVKMCLFELIDYRTLSNVSGTFCFFAFLRF